MASSLVMVARRALVKLLVSMALTYGVALSVSRDSADSEVLKAVRRIMLKVHPDKGGNVGDMQKLQAAREAWDNARNSAKTNGRKGGRPSKQQNDGGQPEDASQGEGGMAMADPGDNHKDFRVRATTVLLTYHVFADLV